MMINISAAFLTLAFFFWWLYPLIKDDVTIEQQMRNEGCSEKVIKDTLKRLRGY